MLRVFIILFILSVGFVPALVKAENAGAVPEMNAEDFESWMTRSRDRRKTGEDPKSLAAALLARAAEDRKITDLTVMACLAAFRGFEGEAGVASGTMNYSATRALIDSLVTRFQDRPFLVAELLRAKGDLLHNEGKLKEAGEALDGAAKLFSKVGLACDRGKIYCGVTSGQLNLVTKNDHEAEDSFHTVMSYPWYLTRDNDALQELRDNYVRAVRGLVDLNTRKKDAKGLEEIYVVPATYAELLPVIANAFTSIGGDPQTASNLKAMGWDGKPAAEKR